MVRNLLSYGKLIIISQQRIDNGILYCIKIMMNIQHQLKSTNEGSKEQQKEVLTETQICRILNSIQQFLQQYKENIRCSCYILYMIMLIMINNPLYM